MQEKLMKQLVTKGKEDNRPVTSCSTRRTHLTGLSNNSQQSEKKDVSYKGETKVSQIECLTDEWRVCRMKLDEEKQMCQRLERKSLR